MKKSIILNLKFHPNLREDTKSFGKETGVLPSPMTSKTGSRLWTDRTGCYEILIKPDLKKLKEKLF